MPPQPTVPASAQHYPLGNRHQGINAMCHQDINANHLRVKPLPPRMQNSHPSQQNIAPRYRHESAPTVPHQNNQSLSRNQSNSYNYNASIPINGPFCSPKRTPNQMRNKESPPAAHSTPTSQSRPQRPMQPLPNSNPGVNNNHVDINNQKSPTKSKKSLIGLFKKKKKEDPREFDVVDQKPRIEQINRNANGKFSDQYPIPRSTVSDSGRIISNQNIIGIPQTNRPTNTSDQQPLGIPLLKNNNSRPHSLRYPKQFNSASLSRLQHRSNSVDRFPIKSKISKDKEVAKKISSSDEEINSLSSQSVFGSNNSLSRNGSLTKKSRSARTERYLRRKSHELGTLKSETEKDRKNKEVVEAKIQDFQQIQQKNQYDQSNKVNQPVSRNSTGKAEPQLQTSTEYNVCTIPNPLGMKPMPKINSPNSVSTDSSVHSNQQMRKNTSMAELPRSFNRMNFIDPQMSVSYDCNINTAQSNPNRSGITPPQPPPRDKSRMFSPTRPISYSFENVNHRNTNGGSLLSLSSSKCTNASQGIRAVLSQSRANSINSNRSPSPNTQYSSEKRNSFVNKPPLIPPLPVSLVASDYEVKPRSSSKEGNSLASCSFASDCSSRSSTPRTDRSNISSMQSSRSMPTTRLSGKFLKRRPTSSESFRKLLGKVPESPVKKSPDEDIVDCPTLNEISSPISQLDKSKEELKRILEEEEKLRKKKIFIKEQINTAYEKDKFKLTTSNNPNLEKALNDLEKIYANLRLEYASPITVPKVTPEKSDDEIDKDLSYPDIEKDDMHLRRYKQNSLKSSPDETCKNLSGSYLSLLNAYEAADNGKSNPTVFRKSGVPDIVQDDAMVRYFKRSKSLKGLDPQPLFGIPVGPITQASPNNYLEIDQDSCVPTRREPDPASDDFAYRNLRKDNVEREVINQKQFLPTYDDMIEGCQYRSQSADRAQCDIQSLDENNKNDRLSRIQTPRRIKHLQTVRKLYNPLRECHDDDDADKEFNLTTTRAVSQPDIRRAIIREAQCATGGPDQIFDVPLADTSQQIISESAEKLLKAPSLVKIQTLNNSSTCEGFVAKTLYKPQENIFNNKPKPFYKPMSTSFECESQTFHKPNSCEPVDVEGLETLISSISSCEYDKPIGPRRKLSTLRHSFLNELNCSSEILNTEKNIDYPYESQNALPVNHQSDYLGNLSVYDKYEVRSAKRNIMDVVQLSMALDSSGNEANHQTPKHHVKNR